MRWLFFPLFFLVISGILFGYSLPVKADTVAANITADELSYDYDLKQIEAVGQVQITYKEITIKCDQAIIDQEQDILLATGNVEVTQKSDSFSGDKFLYYLQSEQGWIYPINMEITDEQITGAVKYSATEAFIKGEEIRSKKAFFTSCDLDNPHFHFTADSIEYYPNKRIVFHGLWYWEGKVRLLYTPILFISLTEDHNNLDARLGWDEFDGWYLLLGYNYYVNDNSYGKINTKFTEHGINEYGDRHYFQISPTSRWFQEVAYDDKAKINYPLNDYMYNIGYENWTNPKLKLYTDYKDWHRFNEVGYSYLENWYNFQLVGSTPYPAVTLNCSETGESYQDVIDLAASWNYNPTKSSSIILNGRWDYSNSLTTPEPTNSYKYRLYGRQDWIWSNLSVTYDQTRVLSGNVSSTNIKPDLVYTIPKLTVPVLGDLRVVTEYLAVDKFPSESTGERWGLDLQKNPIKLWGQGGLTLNTQDKLTYRSFLIDGLTSDLTAFTSDLGLVNQFTKELSTEVRVGFTETEGTPNSYFPGGDYILGGAFLTNGWYWRSVTFNASLNTGYNFKTEYASPVNILMNWLPDLKSQLSFNTSYDWYLGLGQTNLLVNYQPRDDWRLAMSLGYNFQNSDFPWTDKEFEAQIAQKLNNKWKMELATRYDFFNDVFSMGQVNFIMDWHCREVEFSHDWVNQNDWIQLIFKAYPQMPLQLNSTPFQFTDLVNQ